MARIRRRVFMAGLFLMVRQIYDGTQAIFIGGKPERCA
jgi:hypothetical protein